MAGELLLALVLVAANAMRTFYLATKPLVDLLNAMGNLVLKPFGVPPASEAGHQPHSEDELRELLRESSREGLIEQEEQRLSEAALVFGDMRAREVMKPRGEIDFVLTTDSARTIAQCAIATGRTRLPLCEPDGGLESALGAINAKDLLPLIFEDAQRLELSRLTRPLAHMGVVPHGVRRTIRNAAPMSWRRHRARPVPGRAPSRPLDELR